MTRKTILFAELLPEELINVTFLARAFGWVGTQAWSLATHDLCGFRFTYSIQQPPISVDVFSF